MEKSGILQQNKYIFIFLLILILKYLDLTKFI